MSASTSTVEIQLLPRPGFCIKTATLAGAVVPHKEAATLPPSTTAVPEGLKVFVNIAWDPNVPPAPRGSEEAIIRAIHGDDVEENDAKGFYIPAIVSAAREERDKAGKPALVFDCIYNTTLKARLISDPEVREFIIELSLQRIEAKTGLILSREVKTPNIASKGKLLPRSARVPAVLLLETPMAEVEVPLSESARVPKNIAGATEETSVPILVNQVPRIDAETTGTVGPPPIPLQWSWSKEATGKLRIEVTSCNIITPSIIQNATLDIESRKLEMVLPGEQALHIDMDLSDAEITTYVQNMAITTSEDKEVGGEKETWVEQEISRRLRLKRERDFDVENADARWEVGTSMIVIFL